MCGILLNVGNEKISSDHPGLNIIEHRGPDGFGARSFDLGKFRIGLGHRRLSIIDLSECGNQPMSYAGEKLWIVFNGEIYNYREIRKELEGLGFVFASKSDTEVILAAYKKWGNACLNRFNGMFSFVIYDIDEKSLFIARDRFGIKPLYYFNSKKGFRVCSELKQFLSLDGFYPKINKTKLYHYLNSGDFSFDDQTLWENVRELEPGHSIKIVLEKWTPGDEIIPQKWYEAPFFDKKLNITFEDAVCEFRNLLQDSVKLRLRSDVPVGFLLSGGIDSSTLVGLGQLLSGERTEHLKTYSSCYNNSAIDERDFINEMIRSTGAEHCLHFPQPSDISANIEKVIWHNDIPVLHGSPSVHWLLYQKIKTENDSRKVIIEGQGGDEIMCGYGDFHWAYLNEKLHSDIPDFLRQISQFQRIHHEPFKIMARKFLRINFPSSVSFPPNAIIRREELLGSAPLPPIAIRREEANVSKLHRNRFKILRYILHNVDRNSMAHSREARTPFLDYRLVEFCLRLPSNLKISNGYTKRVLRRAAEQIIPAKIANRTDKQGYSSPVAMWAKEGLCGFFKENLEQFSKLPFVNGKMAQDKFEKYIAGKTHFDPVLWRIIATGIWIEKFGMK
ncbi:MAG TPA: asparagine synthase (glutamine-hydrolyzing) [Victivallales bacterium]|nr:asparagine synthase (glutamine-hydrolyzing) [Victivallales bacterium]